MSLKQQLLALDRATGTVNPNATHETKSLLRFFRALTGSKSWVLGTSELYHAWYGKADDGSSTDTWNDFHAISGKYPGLVHHDYTPTSTTGIGPARQATMRAAILEQAAAGAIIELFHPFGNPTTGTLDMVDPYGQGTGQNGDSTGGIAPLKSGGAAHAAWLAILSDLCDFISSLEINGVKIPVIWRPFHEFTINLYWWSGYANAADLVIVWQEMVDYMVNVKGCTNVLFSQNWDSSIGDSVHPWIDYYAGSAYVDIVGFDSYDNGTDYYPAVGGAAAMTLDSNGLFGGAYNAITTIARTGSHPIFVHETGFRYAASNSPGEPGLWDKYVGGWAEQKYPNLSSILLWNHPFGPHSSNAQNMRDSFTAMCNSPHCLTLDKLAALPVFDN